MTAGIAAAAIHQPVGLRRGFNGAVTVSFPFASAASLASILCQRSAGASGAKPYNFSRILRSNSLSFEFIGVYLLDFPLEPIPCPGQLRLRCAFTDVQC